MSDRTSATPEALTVLRPGDRVLVIYDKHCPIQHVQTAIKMLRERFPDVEFSAMVGHEQVIIERADAA